MLKPGTQNEQRIEKIGKMLLSMSPRLDKGISWIYTIDICFFFSVVCVFFCLCVLWRFNLVSAHMVETKGESHWTVTHIRTNKKQSENSIS